MTTGCRENVLSSSLLTGSLSIRTQVSKLSFETWILPVHSESEVLVLTVVGSMAWAKVKLIELPSETFVSLLLGVVLAIHCTSSVVKPVPLI